MEQQQAQQPQNNLGQVLDQVGRNLINLASQTQNQFLVTIASLPDGNKPDAENAADYILDEVMKVVEAQYKLAEDDLLGQVVQADVLVVKQELTKLKDGVDQAVAGMVADHKARVDTILGW